MSLQVERANANANAENRAVVACPSCGKRRAVTPSKYLCGTCGTWFVVKPARDDSQEVGADE